MPLPELSSTYQMVEKFGFRHAERPVQCNRVFHSAGFRFHGQAIRLLILFAHLPVVFAHLPTLLASLLHPYAPSSPSIPRPTSERRAPITAPRAAPLRARG